MKNHQKDTCRPGDGLHKFRQLPDLIILWHEKFPHVTGSSVPRIRDSTKHGGREQFHTQGLRIGTQSLNIRFFRSLLYKLVVCTGGFQSAHYTNYRLGRRALGLDAERQSQKQFFHADAKAKCQGHMSCVQKIGSPSGFQRRPQGHA